MPVETAADRAIFVSANDWGVEATYPKSKFRKTISGIFDNDFVEVEAGGVPFAMQQPRFLAPTADVATIAEGDTLIITGTTYVVRVVQADGTGMTNLVLEKQ